MTIEQIQQPVLKEYQLFHEEFRRLSQDNVELLNQVVEYLSQFPGKQIRPLLVLLSAKAAHGISEKHIKVAAAVEMLHNASLMHDDVVDESDSRRNHDSIRHRWGNQVAVLCGDYFLANVMSIMQALDHKKASNIFNNTVSTMCVGELKQMASIHKKGSLESYIDIIGCKTASLLSACCELGGICFDGEDKEDYCKALKEYGYHYGIIFQIRDDINDFNSQHDAAIPSDVDPQAIIDEHIHLAQKALETLPESDAKQVMLNMLQPSAPQPVC